MARYTVSFLTLKTYVAHVVIVVVVLLIIWPVIYANEKLESNARKLFNLVAEQLSEAFNGFTPRPYSLCEAEYTKDEIIGLARYMRGKKLVQTFIRENLVIFTFSMGISPLKEAELHHISYVSFDDQGKVNVHISEYDYKRYKEEITFDLLCASMGNTFKRFLGYYKNGVEERITVELKSERK
jgi:hypothetical protein